MLRFLTPSIIVALLLIVFVSSLREILRTQRFIRSAPRIRAADLSDLNIPPYAPTVQMIDQLKALGFRRVGEAGFAEDRVARFWYLVDEKGTTAAAVSNIGGTAHATIYSWFGDEACIVYSIPVKGLMVTQHDYLYRPLNTTAAVAYPQHLAAVQDFTMQFGAPRHLDTMVEILRLDTVYNQRFVQHRVARDIRRAAIRAGAALVLAIILIAVVLLRGAGRGIVSD
jgi:hypothetical protein